MKASKLDSAPFNTVAFTTTMLLLNDNMEYTPRILYVDAFDSFTNNVIGLLEHTLKAHVSVIKINDQHAAECLSRLVSEFDAVVTGPGPGHPSIPDDVGLINQIWTLSEEEAVPVLGVCLGFQSLCYNFGASVEKLPSPRHGIVTRPVHNNEDIFSGIGDFDATQYHSLHVNLSADDICWQPSTQCPVLQPLAWDVNDETNGPVLMAVRHTHMPFWGVQFHPESICTSTEGKRIIANWWRQASEWNRGHKPLIAVSDSIKLDDRIDSAYASSQSSLSQEIVISPLARDLMESTGSDAQLQWTVHDAGELTPSGLTEALGLSNAEVVLLDSQCHASGNFSIIGLVIPDKTMNVTYSVGGRSLHYGSNGPTKGSMAVDSIDDVWPILQEALDMHDPHLNGSSAPPPESPFWGGFMGYISYEAGLETINVLNNQLDDPAVPDMNFVFVHRSIIFDHAKSQIYIQSLLADDQTWISNVGKAIDGLVALSHLTMSEDKSSEAARDDKALSAMLANAELHRPTESAYRAKVLRCQEYLASGDSYELCLTDETEIKVPTCNQLDPWLLYKRLRRNNPAPFGAFVKLADSTIVGSSPERFLRWTRDGHCQFRPIKGTVKKGPDMTRERAHEILNSSKERAENLMIVDLIRHDLGGVQGIGDVQVPKLMIVEEYEKVYQLVSVIEGQLSPRDGASSKSGYSPRGTDVLKASLSPGSMTGAPKKRSCEILTGIEGRRRGVYSGVLGYMDVGGAGDFSVVIRTAVKAGVTVDGAYESWRVGAGGAVTIQSTDAAEFHEMETKASSVLGALGFAV